MRGTVRFHPPSVPFPIVVIILLQLLFITIHFSQATTPRHERLRTRNDFNTAEEVVSYYCARDASGFVWSGLLDGERKAFTLWKDIPQQDTFYIAKKYQIIPVQGKQDEAVIEVRYEVEAIGDAFGTRSPALQPDYRVKFSLKRVNGTWKIAAPDYREISPVVLGSKFIAQAESQ